jgi:16S rRNA processing protein RimM
VDDPSDERIVVGRVLKPRGIRGEAFLYPLTDFVERFQALRDVTCELSGGRVLELRVSYVKSYGKRLAIKFKGVDTPEDAVAYRQGLLTVARTDVHALPDGTYYVFDIEGMPVVTDEGDALGVVKEVLTYPANDIFVVDRGGKDLMVPAVREWMEVDWENRRVVVRNAEALLG